MIKLRFFDMIALYIDEEKHKAARQIEVSKRGILEAFAFYLDKRKGLWSITDITEEDGVGYYKHLKYREKGVRQTEKKIKVITHFMEYAVNQDWIEEKPWHHLFEKRGREGHFRIKEKERTKLLEYLKLWRPNEFFEKRDRAMLLLLLQYKLQKTEISRLNLSDYNGNSLKIQTPFQWRNREIKLNEIEIEAIDEYLNERKVRKEAPYEKALFIGYKRHRIAPGMVKQKLQVYLDRIDSESKAGQ